MKDIVNIIRDRLGLTSIDQKLDKYFDLEKSKEEYYGQVQVLIDKHANIKNIAENNLSSINKGETKEDETEFLIKAITEKYNNYYSIYLDDIIDIKNHIEKIDVSQYNLLKGNTTLEKEVNRFKKERLLEKDGKYVYKEYMTHSLERTRDSMPQIDEKDLDKFLIHFADKAKIKKYAKKLKDIKPTQSDINDEKVLSMYKNIRTKKRDTPYIISKDGYLMDGHHHWAANLEDDVDQDVDVYEINVMIKQLLKRANQLKISTKKDIEDNVITKADLQVILEACEQDLLPNEVLIKATKKFLDYNEIMKTKEEKKIIDIEKKELKSTILENENPK